MSLVCVKPLLLSDGPRTGRNGEGKGTLAPPPVTQETRFSKGNHSQPASSWWDGGSVGRPTLRRRNIRTKDLRPEERSPNETSGRREGERDLVFFFSSRGHRRRRNEGGRHSGSVSDCLSAGPKAAVEAVVVVRRQRWPLHQ